MTAKEKAAELKDDLASLKKQQDDEIKLLKITAKEMGLSSKEINALIAEEKKANKLEYNEAKASKSVEKNEAGYVYSDLAVAAAAGLLPKQQAAAQQTLANVQQALDFMDANDLQQNASKKGVGTGIMGGYILSEMSNAATPAEALQIAKTLGAKHPSEAVKIVEELKTSTPQEGEKLKQVKGNADVPPEQGSVVYTTRKVGDGRTLSTVYLQTPDGNFQELGNTYQSVNTKEGIGIIGQLALGALGAFVLSPAIGAAFGGGSTGAIAGGALSGGITSELGGGDFLQGAALGAAGGAFNTSVADSIGSNMVRSIQESLASSLGDQLANIVARSATSATLGAVQSGILGRDVLTGAGLSALGSATQSAVGNALNQLNLPPGMATEVAKAASNAAAAGVVAAVQGTDVGMAVGSSLGASGLKAVGETFFAGGRPSGPAPIEEKSTVAGSPQAALPPGYFSATAGLNTGTMTDVPSSVAAGTAGAYRAAGADATVGPDGSVIVTAPRLGDVTDTDIFSMLGTPTSPPSSVPVVPSAKDIKDAIARPGAATGTPGTTPGAGAVSVPGGTPAGVPSGVPGGEPGGIPGGTSGGVLGGSTFGPPVDVTATRPRDVAPPVDVTAKRDTDMAPPVDVTAPRLGPDIAPPVEVTEKKATDELPAEGTTTYFGGTDVTTPSTPGFDKTLITFLGLDQPPVQKKTPLRGAPPGLITGSEDTDLSALFGGKPEELQDVWNQQSLRLRSALGI
jgi:hypothetical protein